MLAVGPISILPSPLLAAVPAGSTAPFTVLNGTANWNGSGNLGTVTASDRAIVAWNQGSFNIAAGETYSFLVPAGGAILNKVGYTSTGALGSGDSASINGTLTSTGKVFVLANGNIFVGQGAVINTAGGLVLSTLAEPDNFTFATSGNLSFTGTSNGTIVLGNFIGSTAQTTSALVNVAGNLGTWAGETLTNNLSVTGDLVVNQRSSNTLLLSGAAGNTTVNGNLTVNSANATISQGSSPIVQTGTGSVATFSTNGTQNVTLTNALNNFVTVGGNVLSLSVTDRDSIIIGATTVANNLSVSAGNNITTSGTVTVANNASLASSGVGDIVFANNSTVAGTLSATAAGGNVTINTAGNLTTGTLSAPIGGGFLSGPVTITSGGSGYTAAPTVTFSGGGGTGAVGIATFNSTTGQLSGVTVTNAGTGYTSAPTIILSGGGASPSSVATANATLVSGLASLTILSTSGGAGYSVAPTVTITGGGGTGATATATISAGVVTGFTITANGTGYTSEPTITLGAVTGVVTAADASAVVRQLEPTKTIGSLNISGTGAGYTAVPTLTIAGGGGTGAAGTAAITSGAVSSLTLGAGGTGFTSAPSVSIVGSGLSPSTAGSFLQPSTLAASTINVTTSGALTIGGTSNASAATFTGGSVVGNATGNVVTTGPVTINSTAGNVVLPQGSASRFTVNAVGGSISQLGSTALTSASGTTQVFNAGNGSITLTGNNAFTNGVLQLTGNSATVNSSTSLILGTSNITGNLTINTLAAATPGSGNVTLGTAFGTAAQDSTVGGSLTINTNNGSTVSDDPSSITNVFGNVNINTAPSGFGVYQTTVSGGSGYTSVPTVTVSGGGGSGTSVTVSSMGVAGFTVLSGGVGYTAAPTITFSGGGGTGAVGVGIITGGILTGINITNAGSGYTSVPTATFSVSGSSSSATVNLGLTPNGLTITSNGTGYTSPPSFSFSSAGQTANATITASNMGGTTQFTGASAGVTGGGRYGTFNVTSATININEQTTLAAGNIFGHGVTLNSTGGDLLLNGTLSANTFSGNANAASIMETGSGVVNILSTSTFRSSNSFGTNLSNTANQFGGAVTITNGLTNIIVAGSNLSIASGTSVTAGNSSVTLSTVGAPNNNVTLNGNITRTVVNSGGNVSFGGGTFNTLTVTANDTSATSISQSAFFTTNGTVTLGSQGNITLNTVGNNFTGNLVLSGTGGDVSVASARDLRVSGTSNGNVTVAAGRANAGASTNTFSNPWSVFLGNLNAKSLNVGALNGNTTSSGLITGNTASGGNATAGNSGSIVQLAGTSLHIENTIDAVSFGGDIILNNAGNSFGRVQASTGGGTGFVGSGNISVTEDSTLKVGQILTNGTASLTSTFGSILEDAVNNVIITANGTSSVLTLNAPAGSVQLGGINRTSGTTTGNIVAATINAAGSAQIQSSGNLTLGAINANSLTVTGNNISQSAALNVFGSSTFNATNSIALTNPSNNFGPLNLTSQTANQSISVTEANTLNLRSVSMQGGGNTTGGTFTANSINGDIIDTGFAGVRLGGGLVNNVPVTGQGIVTLSATNGNIIIDDGASDILSTSGVVFNAKDVTIDVLGSLGSTLVLGANATPSSASGNLIARSTLGNIGNAGPLSVSGGAFFETGNGNITIGQNGNVGFGTLRFVGNQVSISETGSMDILTGSTAFGPANLVSGGSIAIINAGNGLVTFGNSVAMSATGNITLTNLQAVGNLAVTATGTKDLSALSLSNDLNSKTPIFGGTGANVDPKP